MSGDPLAAFAGVERVVADTLRFKRKLAIGEDAYASLRLGKAAARLWDVGGVAATGGALAASPVVASTFFASTGWMASLGLGAVAVTPIGWVLAAAAVTGGAYYGVTRAIGAYSGSRVEVIPKFINTPIDQLGAALLDMMGALGLKVAMMDGVIDPAERAAMVEYFAQEWGFDRAYAAKALEMIEAGGLKQPIKEMTAGVARFVQGNPDCNAGAFCEQLIDLLREVAQADGVIDEREEMAIEAIGAVFANEGGVMTSVGAAVGTAGTIASSAANAVGSTAQKAGGVAADAGMAVAGKAARLAADIPSILPKRK